MLWGVCHRRVLKVFTRSGLGLFLALPFAVFGATVAISPPLPPPSASLIVKLPDGTERLVPLQPTDKLGTSLENRPAIELNIASVPTYKFSITAPNPSLTTTTLREINLITGAQVDVTLTYWMAVVPGGLEEAEPGAAPPPSPGTPSPNTATLSPRDETLRMTTRTFSASDGIGLPEGRFLLILPVPGGRGGDTSYFGTVLAGVLTGNGLQNPVAVRERREAGPGSSPRSASGSNTTSALRACSLSVGSPTVNLFNLVWVAMTLSLLLGLALRIRRNHNKA